MRFKRLDSEQAIRDLIRTLSFNPNRPIALDLETTGLNPRTCDVIDIQITGETSDDAYAFEGKFLPLLKEISNPFIFWNCKYDLAVAYYHGVDLTQHSWFDAMVLVHLVKEDAESYSLDHWVQKYWQDDYKKKFWSKYETYSESSEDDRLVYGCKDVIYTHKLFDRAMASISSAGVDPGLVGHSHRTIRALLNITLNGIAVDLPYMADLSSTLDGMIRVAESQIRALVPEEIDAVQLDLWAKELNKRKTEAGRARVPKPDFNLDSSSQVKSLLYEKLDLPPQINEKTKKPSVDDDSLSKIADLHPVVQLIQTFRTHNKVKGSFIDGILDRLQEGRIYPSFHVQGTATGRLSASDPNLQQVPQQGGIRGMYVADPGYKLIGADFGMLEVVLAAHFSGDKQLTRMVLEGLSMHDITSEALGIDRNTAKTVNFALQYRASKFKLAKILKISEAEAEIVFQKYWDTYSGLQALMNKCDKMVDEGTAIQNPFGRRRRFEVYSRSPWDKAYRQAYNFLIQSTGADMTNKAFYMVDEELKRRGWGYALFPVHDEVIIHVKEEHAEQADKLLVDTMLKMRDVIRMTLPLKVESSGPQERWVD